MNKHIAAVLAATALTLGGLTAAPAAVASAGPDGAARAKAGCVTQGEFRKAKKGMRIKKVHRIFGTKGKREALPKGYGITIEIRGYKTCTKYGAVSVLFENGKLSTKSAVF